MVQRRLEAARALDALPEPVVVNCTGLGARALFGDDELLPCNGQFALLAPQPEIDYMVVAPREGLYMLPRHAIVLGTSHERDCWLLAPNAEKAARILDGHRALFSGVARSCELAAPLAREAQ